MPSFALGLCFYHWKLWFRSWLLQLVFLCSSHSLSPFLYSSWIKQNECTDICLLWKWSVSHFIWHAIETICEYIPFLCWWHAHPTFNFIFYSVILLPLKIYVPCLMREIQAFTLTITKWFYNILFPDQGLNLCPQQWKRWVLTTGPQGVPSLSPFERLSHQTSNLPLLPPSCSHHTFSLQ